MPLKAAGVDVILVRVFIFIVFVVFVVLIVFFFSFLTNPGHAN